MVRVRRALARITWGSIAAAAASSCASAPPIEPVPISTQERPHDLVIATDDPTPPVIGEPPLPQGGEACAVDLPARLGPDCRPLLAVGVIASSGPDATRALDGDQCTFWNAGGFTPQSLTIDLGEPTAIDALVLVPEMSPDGSVVHVIELSNDGKTFPIAHRIEAPMRTNTPVNMVLPKRERARFVRVATQSSPSWVAWREISLVRCGTVQGTR